jgi:uncharacterized OB-fold protein
MSLIKEKEEILVAERDFDSIFSYSAGTTRSGFLTEIRDNKKIVGTKCPNCNMVWVPARSICVKCFAHLEEFVEVGNAGEVISYSVVNTSQTFYPLKPPFVIGIIRLDGADTGLVHFIGGVDSKDVKIGMRVQAVFSEERIGSILDIKHFKPVGG